MRGGRFPESTTNREMEGREIVEHVCLRAFVQHKRLLRLAGLALPLLSCRNQQSSSLLRLAERSFLQLLVVPGSRVRIPSS